MTLDHYPKSWTVRHGGCGALLNSDTECELPAGHLAGDLPHRSHGPYGGQGFIEYDDAGHIVNDQRKGV